MCEGGGWGWADVRVVIVGVREGWHRNEVVQARNLTERRRKLNSEPSRTLIFRIVEEKESTR